MHFLVIETSKMIPVHSLESEQESISDRVLAQKRRSGRNYKRYDHGEKEFLFFDEENHLLVHYIRREGNGCFLIELEQIKKEEGCYHVVVYDDKLTQISLDCFENPVRAIAQGEAADKYRKLRDYSGKSICDLLQ